MIVSLTATSPCKDCTERSVRCHSSCERYREYKDTLERNRAEMAEKTAENDFFVSIKREVKKRYWKQIRKDRRR